MPRNVPLRSPKKSAPRASLDRAGADERPDNVSLAYRKLRIAIIGGHLPPGLRLSERTLAERIGLSRTPVRSALQLLEQEGLVTSVGRGRERRLIVAPLTMDDGRQVLLIVGHLEGLAARTAALLAPARRKALVARMRAVNRELAARTRVRSAAALLFDLDVAFHDAFVDGVVGPRLLALHRAIKPQTERYVRLYVSVLLDELPTSVKEHEVIAASIAKGNPEHAQAAVEANWRNAAMRLERIIAQMGERGNWVTWSADESSVAPQSQSGTRRR